MKRLFIAVQPPENIRQKLAHESDILSSELAACKGVKFINPDRFHFTIIFLGGQDEKDVSEIIRIMEESLSETRPFEVIMRKIAYGHSFKDPRMIWAYAVSSGMEKTRKILIKALKRKNIFFPNPEKRFAPHITLARFGGDIPAYGEYPFEEKFIAEKIVLIQSGQNGFTPGEYTGLAEIDLTDSKM